MIEFTKDELFYIEQEFDFKATAVSHNIYKLARVFLEGGCIIENVQERDEFRKMIMKEIQEHHKASDIIDSIRKKCETERRKE